MEQWGRPPLGWYKANVVAAFSGGKATLAVAVRDESGGIIKVPSSLISARKAETKALEWATEYGTRWCGLRMLSMLLKR